MQNKLLKILCRSGRYDSPSTLHNDMSILKVPEACVFFLLCFVFKQVCGMLPDIFNGYFVKNSELEIRRHRSSNDLYVPFCRIEFGRKSIKVTGPKLFNKLPDYIKQSCSFNVFKNSLKRALLEGVTTPELLSF